MFRTPSWTTVSYCASTFFATSLFLMLEMGTIVSEPTLKGMSVLFDSAGHAWRSGGWTCEAELAHAGLPKSGWYDTPPLSDRVKPELRPLSPT